MAEGDLGATMSFPSTHPSPFVMQRAHMMQILHRHHFESHDCTRLQTTDEDDFEKEVGADGGFMEM